MTICFFLSPIFPCLLLWLTSGNPIPIARTLIFYPTFSTSRLFKLLCRYKQLKIEKKTSLGRRQPKKEIVQQKMSRSLSSQLQVQLPQQGSRSISVHATQILQTAWKNTSLPPYIKTFVWRLIRRVLMTGERARRYSNMMLTFVWRIAHW